MNNASFFSMRKLSSSLRSKLSLISLLLAGSPALALDGQDTTQLTFKYSKGNITASNGAIYGTVEGWRWSDGFVLGRVTQTGATTTPHTITLQIYHPRFVPIEYTTTGNFLEQGVSNMIPYLVVYVCAKISWGPSYYGVDGCTSAL